LTLPKASESVRKYFLGITVNKKIMKNIIRYFIVFVFCSYANAQETSEDFFDYKEKKLVYNVVYLKTNSTKFNVIILKSISYEQILKKLKTCNIESKRIGSIYYIVIPEEFIEEKDELVLEFLSYIFSRRKLVDKELNVIADGNYFSLYEKKIVLTRRYKDGLLNKIEKLNIIEYDDNLCEFLK
jgi:hypothetical protein